MKSVLIVCEAGTGLGLGHFYRSLALAQMLSSDFQVMLLSNNSSLPETTFNRFIVDSFEDFPDYKSFEIVVLDGYQFNSRLISKFISESIRFIEISDFQEQLYPTPFWINTSMESDLPGKGLQYGLLRKEILEVAKKRTFEEKKLDSIFVAFGGTDELSNSLKTVEALHDAHYFSRIGVLYPDNGKDAELLKEYAASGLDIEVKIFSNLSAHQLIETTNQYAVALVSSSTIACEMIALRKMVFTCCLYENQQLLHDQLIKSKAAFSANLNEIQEITASLVFQLMHPKINPEAIFNFQKKLIDGFAEERIRNFISNCVE